MNALETLRWLCQDGPSAKKHQEWKHPLVAMILHYVIVVFVSVFAHDALFGKPSTSRSISTSTTLAAQAMAAYVTWLLFWRLFMLQQQLPYNTASVFYEMTWLCNVTLLIAPLAMLSSRPTLALAYSFVVGIDQFLWYVDLLGFFSHRLLVVALSNGSTTKHIDWFPIGVAKYLTWPGVTWTSRITCTHHLWTIPTIWYYATPVLLSTWLEMPWNMGHYLRMCFLTFVVMTVNVLVSRWLTPSAISSKEMKYLNVNLSYALWKDIKFAFLQIQYDDPPPWRYLFRLLWRWQVFNTMIMFGWWLWCWALFLPNQNDLTSASSFHK